MLKRIVAGVAASVVLSGAAFAETEVPFALEGPRGFFQALKRRLEQRGHAVIVLAEGAGQDLFQDLPADRDASGNIQFQDIGPFLKQQIVAHFKTQGPAVDVKYIDPSYIIRSVPANCADSILCDQFARRAVHAAMAGKTNVLIGHMSDTFVHVPIPMAIGEKARLPVESELWTSVLAATGQPRRFA